jgi:hypothetical protein
MDLTKQEAHPDQVEREQKKADALALRMAGNSYRTIGRAIGRHHSVAHDLVIEALREIRTMTAERVADLRTLEGQRLDDLWWKLYPKPTAAGQPTPKLTPEVARQLVNISRSRRQLFGLDLPPFIGGMGGDDLPFDEVADLSRLSTEELQLLEKLTLVAKGRGPEVFGLDPAQEIFDPVPGPDEDAPPALPPAPAV